MLCPQCGEIVNGVCGVHSVERLSLASVVSTVWRDCHSHCVGFRLREHHLVHCWVNRMKPDAFSSHCISVIALRCGVQFAVMAMVLLLTSNSLT